MYFKYLWRINSGFAKCDLLSSRVNTLISCVASILKQWPCHIWPDAPYRVIMIVQREQIQAFWQSPIDHHSILLAICFIVSWHFGLRSCQTRVFHKFGWVFHKFAENGEFYIVWFLALTAIIETPVKQWGRPLHWRSNLINLINLMNDWCLPEILGLPAISRNTRCFGLSATQWFPKPNWVRSGIEKNTG